MHQESRPSLFTDMGTEKESGARPEGRTALLSRQPACRVCRHEEHWLACDWCGCTDQPVHDAPGGHATPPLRVAVLT